MRSGRWLRASAWIVSTLLAVLASLFLIAVLLNGKTGDPFPWHAFALAGCLLIAALLLCPALWRWQSGRGVYARVLLAIALAAVGLFAPIETHAVKLDMPKPPSSH